MDFDKMDENEVIKLSQSGDDRAMEYMLNKYKKYVATLAQNYFTVAGDEQDVTQEGMIGLFKAITGFKPDKDASFKTFANTCITRRIKTAVTATNRKKHSPLNESVSYSAGENESGNSTLSSNNLSLSTKSMEEMYISKETIADIYKAKDKILSKFEKEVFELMFIEDKSYTEIAKKLGKSEKSIDNAIQRIKNKIKNEIK